MTRGVNVLALVKDGERYVFLYDDDSTTTLMQTLGKFASNTELSFTWYDAAVLSQKVRQLTREHAPGAETIPMTGSGLDAGQTSIADNAAESDITNEIDTARRRFRRSA